eukprot:c26268_g1_i1.p1 GENE.c26268_g1_i1~~c26268_g1_i1.p1  ORF type:complete len:156 (-),score=11.33 c26268_g1_i1:585-1019(-)
MACVFKLTLSNGSTYNLLDPEPCKQENTPIYDSAPVVTTPVELPTTEQQPSQAQTKLNVIEPEPVSRLDQLLKAINAQSETNKILTKPDPTSQRASSSVPLPLPRRTFHKISSSQFILILSQHTLVRIPLVPRPSEVASILSPT